MRNSFYLLSLVITIFIHTQSTAAQGDDGSLCFVKDCSYWETGRHDVFIGAYLNDISDFNTDQFTIRFDAYFWIKWNRCTNATDGSTFRPDLSLKLQNVLQRVDLSVVQAFDTPVCDADIDGRYAYMQWRVEGQFNQELHYRSFPLDRHNIWMEFEDNLYGENQLVYIHDNLQKSDKLKLAGWNIGELLQDTRNIVYKSNFGTNTASYAESTYSNYRVGIRIVRGSSKYTLRILPPVIITLAISVMVFLLDLEAMDTRIATAVGGLLAQIFLQLTFAGDLPQSVDYITLLDIVFDIAYAMILAVIVECVIIRSVYYRLLLQSQALKDEIQLQSFDGAFASALSGLGAAPSPPSTEPTGDVVSEAKQLKIRKKRIRVRIRRIEKFFAAVLSGVGILILIIVSLVGRYSW